jgi:hypothetical protein
MRCYYCGVRLTKDNYSIDHLFPKSRGGKNEANNKKACCKECNSEKGNMTEEEYRYYLNEKSKCKSVIEAQYLRYVMMHNIDNILNIKAGSYAQYKNRSFGATGLKLEKRYAQMLYQQKLVVGERI